MARFVLMNGCYFNVDQLISMNYNKAEDETLFVFSDSEFSFAAKGDLTPIVLNANNDLTMHDKLLGRYIASKFKDTLAMILARLDFISKIYKKKEGVK